MKVVIIGGGVVGLSTAYFVVRAGHQVTLIERNRDVAQESSRANGGQLSYSYVAPLANPSVPAKVFKWIFDRESPIRLYPRLDTHQWQWSLAFLRACSQTQSDITTQRLLTLSNYSRQLMRHIVETESLEFDYQQNGKLVVLSTAESMEAAGHQIKLQKTLGGSEQELVDSAGCCAIEPALAHVRHRIVGGILTRSEDTGDCYRFCHELKRVLQGPNFQLLTGVDVKRICRFEESIIALETTDGVIEGDAYVIAAGINSRRLAQSVGIDLPIYPLRGYSLTVPIAKREAAPRLSITDYENKIVYAPLGDKIRIAGFAEFGGDQRTISGTRVADLVRATRAMFPDAVDFGTLEPWCGLRPITPKGTPILGSTPYRNLLINVGHGALGFTLALGAGRAVADIVAGKTPEISLEGMLLDENAGADLAPVAPIRRKVGTAAERAKISVL